MTSPILRLASVIVLATGALMGLSGCFSERVTETVTGAECLVLVPSPIFGANQIVVAMRDYAFQPDTIRIRSGQVVTWVNCDTDGHTSTSDNGVWDSPTLERSVTYSRTFAQTGRFTYHCIPHPSMTGVVIVE